MRPHCIATNCIDRASSPKLTIRSAGLQAHNYNASRTTGRNHTRCWSSVCLSVSVRRSWYPALDCLASHSARSKCRRVALSDVQRYLHMGHAGVILQRGARGKSGPSCFRVRTALLFSFLRDTPRMFQRTWVPPRGIRAESLAWRDAFQW